MSVEIDKARPERESTDGSLRTERSKTDLELARKVARLEKKADEVVDRAGEMADAVVQTARDLADQKTAPAPAAAQARAVEDDRLQVERSQAEEHVRRERDERKRALAGLLRLEREATDEHLLAERGRSDEALDTRDVFLGMVSHDLRTLLGSVALSAELLAREAPVGKPSVHARVEMIQRSIARMNRIIGDLTDIAGIEAGKLAVEPARHDLAALVSEMVETFRSSADARGVALVAEGPQAPLPASIDRDRIVQVLANLLTNAIKFTARGGRVSARAGLVDGEAQVSIADTGCGIPADQLELIFDRYWQARRGDRRGLGLGLYISRCILESHRGRIWARSVVGKGSTFSFTVPSA